MLDARFPRIPGDMGNATTQPFPVVHRVVRGATPERIGLVTVSAGSLSPEHLIGGKPHAGYPGRWR